MSLKGHLVVLGVKCNGYEKQVHHIVLAENVEQAGTMAALQEAHNDLETTSAGWIDDIFWYSVLEVHEPTIDELQVLNKYL